jgi:hypothetical protein
VSEGDIEIARGGNWSEEPVKIRILGGANISHFEEMQKSFADRFGDFNQGRTFFEIFPNPSDASYGNSEPTLLLQQIDLRCAHGFRSKSKEKRPA